MYRRTRIALLAALALSPLSACKDDRPKTSADSVSGKTVSPNPPPPANPAQDTAATAPMVKACDLLTPDLVAKLLSDAKLDEKASSGSSCMYKNDSYERASVTVMPVSADQWQVHKRANLTKPAPVAGLGKEAFASEHSFDVWDGTFMINISASKLNELAPESAPILKEVASAVLAKLPPR